MSDTSHIDSLLSDIETQWPDVGGQTFEQMVDQNEQLQMDFEDSSLEDVVNTLRGLGINIIRVITLDDITDEFIDDSALD